MCGGNVNYIHIYISPYPNPAYKLIVFSCVPIADVITQLPSALQLIGPVASARRQMLHAGKREGEPA